MEKNEIFIQSVRFRRCFFCDKESDIPVLMDGESPSGVYNDGYVICDLCRAQMVANSPRNSF